MGARIAEVLALNNVNVTLRDVDDAALARGRKTIEGDLDVLVAFQAGKATRAIEEFESKSGVAPSAEQKAKAAETLKPTFDAKRKERLLSKITFTTGFDGLDKADLVLQAPPEKPALT